MEDRIAEIVKLQNEATIPSAQASDKKWAEARLIWEEHQYNSFPEMSKSIKAAGGRGSSLGYLSRMERCWRFFVIEPGVEYKSYCDLGDFNEYAYNTDRIQKGDPERKERKPRRTGEQGKHRKESRDDTFSGHSLVMDAYNAVSLLANNPAFWPLLNAGDIARLRAIPDMSSKITDSYRAAPGQGM